MQHADQGFKNQSRRDDLESLAYLLVKIRTGKLPWDKVIKSKDNFWKKREPVIALKNQPAEVICEGMSGEFATFLRDVKSLSFDEEPKYDEYYSMFEKLLNRITTS